MSFLEDIFASLERSGDDVVIQELRDGQTASLTGLQLLANVQVARAYLRRLRLKNGDRCALLAHNSMLWVAMDLAIMAEGLTAVPLYARQAPTELVAMMKDCWPSVIACGDQSLAGSIVETWPEAPPHFCFENVFTPTRGPVENPSLAAKDEDVVTVIYTSGTSGEAKGVMLNASNVGYMLGRTSGRLDQLMSVGSKKTRPGQDAVFHYLPLCFAGSWLMMLTCLLRGSKLTLNSDLAKIAADMRLTAPDYFLNVPALLERMRKAVDEQLWKTGGFPLKVYTKAKGAWVRRQEGQTRAGDAVWLALANRLVFPTIRKKMIGRNLRALICGSAPLNIETQLFFMMLGIPVLQVYGLTETTAICTMDDPDSEVTPGRVGPAISGVQMKIGDNDEIVVQGPNIFPGYWGRPEETAKVLRDGWFHTGDQGEVDANGNWKIVGRIKSLIVLGSGHNVAPEPIEDRILRELPEAIQVVLVGNGRGYLGALVTGKVNGEKVQAALDAINPELPHYRQVRAFHLVEEAFTIESGLLTANGKLKRDLIAERFGKQIDAMYLASKNQMTPTTV
ncbi:MAG TPA: AMP-binding protein [Terriglobales bacterium]|jgi:long-chain acyl-CoA synthetase|nr:AMP-binding protein [Terriglobales bacterium]